MRYLVTNQQSLFDTSNIDEDYRYTIISPEECLRKIIALKVLGLDTEKRNNLS